MTAPHRSTSLSLAAGRWALLLALLPVAVVAVSGCDRGPAMYQVRGKVLYPDGSVPQGAVAVVRFQPSQQSTAEIRRGASGAIGPDGSFELYTRMPGDGVYEGEYDVSFAVMSSVMNPTPLIREKYTNAATSGYSVTVDRHMDDLEFEIEPLPGAPRGQASSAAEPLSGGTTGSG